MIVNDMKLPSVTFTLMFKLLPTGFYIRWSIVVSVLLELVKFTHFMGALRVKHHFVYGAFTKNLLYFYIIRNGAKRDFSRFYILRKKKFIKINIKFFTGLLSQGHIFKFIIQLIFSNITNEMSNPKTLYVLSYGSEHLNTIQAYRWVYVNKIVRKRM